MPTLMFAQDADDDGIMMPYEPTLASLHDLSPILDTSVFAEVHPTSAARDDDNDNDNDNDDDDDMAMQPAHSDDDRSYSLGQIASVAQSQSAARVRRRRGGGVAGSAAPLRRQRGFYQLDMPPWLPRTRRPSIDGIASSGSDTPSSSYDDDDGYVDLLQASHDYHHRRRGNNASSGSRDPRLVRRTRTRALSRRSSSSHYSNYCIGETAVDLSSYSKKAEPQSVLSHQLLDFDIMLADGGQYRYDFTADDGGSLFGVENILRNDDSVYCSGRSGTINILLQYCGATPTLGDKSCVVSQILIKSPQHGFTAPCKEGLFFISYHPIDIEGTAKFDDYTQSDYERYVRLKGGPDMLDDSDPVAWFSMSSDKQDAIHLNDRLGKYVLIKLLRAEGESENIDLQYVALIGYSGARAFASARIC